MSVSVFILIRPRNRRTPIRKHMFSKHLYAQQSSSRARIFTVPGASEIALEPR
jgi:hypothetical protein